MRRIGTLLVGKGHRVRILCCQKGHPLPAEEELDGVEILREGRRATALLTMPRRYAAHQNWADVVIESLLEIPLLTPLYVRKPLVVLVYHLLGSEWFSTVPLPQATIGYLAERISLPLIYRGSQFVAISETTRQDLLRYGVPDAKVEVIPLGCDSELYCPKGSKTPSPSLLFVGRLDDGRKRIEDLIPVLELVQRQYADTELFIAGPGEKAVRLREVAKGKRIHVLGFVDDTTKVRLYQQSWIHVIPSTKEGFGLTALEASACGTPVVAYAAPGLVGVKDGENGILVPVRDVPAMADAICRIIGDPALRAQLAGGGLALSRQFTWAAAADRFMQIIEKTLPAFRASYD